MSIVNRIKDVARYRDRHSVNVLGEEIADIVAGRLPRRVKLGVVVGATNDAIRIRETEPQTAIGYWGPDGVTYEHQHDALQGVNTKLKHREREDRDDAEAGHARGCSALDPDALGIVSDEAGFTVFNTWGGGGSMTLGPFLTRELAERAIDEQREIMRRAGHEPGRYDIQASGPVPSIEDLKGDKA